MEAIGAIVFVAIILTALLQPEDKLKYDYNDEEGELE